jgi:hypothetical protein
LAIKGKIYICHIYTKVHNTLSEEEALRKRAEEKFFERGEFRPRELYALIERVSNFVTMNEKGDVFIKLSKCTGLEKVQLVLSARFLGNRLREEIHPELTYEEVAKYTGLEPKIATARLTDCVRLGFAERVSKGMYRVHSLTELKEFIDELETKYRRKGSEYGA